jgi:hypothetical protein
VFFKSSNGSFSGVAAMTVRWTKLIFHIIDSEKVFQSGGCFGVKGLKLGFETLGSELLMDVVICFDPFRRGPVLHRDSFHVISVRYITDHDVPFALADLTGNFPVKSVYSCPWSTKMA